MSRKLIHLAQLNDTDLTNRIVGKALSQARNAGVWDGVIPVCTNVKGGLRIIAFRRNNLNEGEVLDEKNQCVLVSTKTDKQVIEAEILTPAVEAVPAEPQPTVAVSPALSALVEDHPQL